MALPINHRQLLIDDINTKLTALKSITEGSEYRHKLVTVTDKPAPVDQVDPSLTPWACIVGGDGQSGNAPSNSDTDEMTVVIFGYVYEDLTRWSTLTAPKVCEEVLCDIEKAIDADLGHGGRAFGSTRERELIHELSGKWSVFTLRENIRYNRRRTS